MFPFDTETYPIRPGRQAPRVVCVQSCAGGIELRAQGLARLRGALERSDLVYGHYAAFDACATAATNPSLLPLWFEAYSNDRVTCTRIREKLILIGRGRLRSGIDLSLLGCLERRKIPHGFSVGDKSDPNAWRLRYSELDGVPVEEWPEDARRYALADLAVEDLYEAQAGDVFYLDDQFRQARADFWLYLTSANGMRVDQRAASALAEKIEAEHAETRARLQAADLVRSDGSKDTKAAKALMIDVCARREITPELTDTGQVSLNADACAASGEPLLRDYARYTSIGSLRSRVQRLQIAGGLPIQPRFDVLKKTGRTSSSKGEVKIGSPRMAFGDQVQNLHREPGIRECYVPRPGYVLASVDWSGAELHSLAQVCTWMGLDSKLAEVLRAGRDAHLHFAATTNTWDYEWARTALRGDHGEAQRKIVKAARQGAKAFNFGFPGGLGIENFRAFALKTYDQDLTDREAREGKAAWFATYPEMRDYFRWISALTETDEPLRHYLSNRYRGDLTYTAAANSYFQGHTADMAKDAGWRLARAYYGIDPSPLNRARPWNFVHDEFIAEVPEETAHECAIAMVEIMEAAGRDWCPDVPVKAEPALSRRWRKGAGPVYRDARLIPWEDRPFTDEHREKTRELLDRGIDPIQVSWRLGFEEETINGYATAA